MAKRVFEIFFKGDPKDALGAFDQLGDKVEKAEGKLGKVGTAAAGAGLAIGTAAVGAAGALFKLGSDFDGVYDGIQTTTGKTGKDLDALKDSFRAVVKDVPTDFASAGQAIGDLSAKTGLTGKPLEAMSANVLNLSRITGTDLKTNIEKAAKATQDWGLPADKAAGSLDVLFKASQKTGVNFAQLSDSMDKVGPTARGMGLTFDETAGLLSQLEKAGVDSGAVFKGLTKDLVGQAAEMEKAHAAEAKANEKLDAARQLAATGAKGAADKVKAAQFVVAAAHLAVDAAEKKAAEGAAGMKKGLEETSSAIKNASTDQEALAIATEAFGKKAGPELADAIRTGKISLEDLSKAAADSAGAIGKTATDTADGQERMQLAFNRAKIALEPLATKMFEFGAQLAEKVAPIIETVATWIAEKLVPAVQDVAKWIGENVIPVLQDMATWFNDNIVPAVQSVVGWLNDNLIPAIQSVASFFKDTLIPAAQAVWDKLTGFIGWLKSVFSADWEDVFQGVKDFFEGIWNGLVSFLTDWLPNKLVPKLADILGKFAGWAADIPVKVLAAIGEVGATLLDKGKDLLQGLWDGAKDVFGQVVAWHVALPKALFDAIGDVTRTLLERGKDLLEGLWGGAKEVFVEVIAWHVAIPRKVFDAIGDVGRTLLSRGTDLVEGFFDGVTAAWDRLKGFFGDIKDKVVALVGNAAGWLTSTASDLIGGFLSGVSAPFLGPSGAVFQFFSNAPDKIVNAVKQGASALVDVGEWIIDKIKSGMSGAWHFIIDYVVDKIRALPGAVGGFLGNVVSVIPGVGNAEGSVVRSPIRTWVGEGFLPEVIIPLTKPDRIRTLMSDPLVASAIGSAMGGTSRGVSAGWAGAAAGGAARPGVTVVVQGDVYGERDFVMKIRDGLYELDRQGVSMPWD